MDSLGGAGLGAGGSDFGCGCGFQPLASLAAVLSRPPGALFPLSRPRAGALPSTCSHPALQTPGCAPGSLQWARGFWTWAILLPSLKPMSDHAIAQRSRLEDARAWGLSWPRLPVLPCLWAVHAALLEASLPSPVATARFPFKTRLMCPLLIICSFISYLFNKYRPTMCLERSQMLEK